MDTAYRGGWFSDQRSSTGESPSLSLVQEFILAASLFVCAGTGALTDDLSRLRHEQKNKPIISNPIRTYTTETTSERSAAEDLEQIRKVLSPAVSDLAKSFNVSRQTIYNWLKGEQPTPEHAEKLRDLALVADTFAESGVSVNGVLLKRKVIKGKSLLDIIREGGSARDTSQLLLQIVQSETSQRKRLASRFAGRKASQPSADSDITEAYDEV